ncbi:class Ib ribonucleoside-diphosphate reductase assembly flavoprotein NrdI [Streptococcus sp. H49]|uniref:class Ib ribonucleoside-diphosphate reductase assembly flavoprotein NrdI n=1 Tax=Streptococcus huangxiaojuni TaxID=3237239 RepID=UPI0034A19B97
MVRIVYATRSGNVEKIVKSLNWTDSLKITDGTERVEGDYVIFTYSTGKGAVPKPVRTFLEANPGVKAVVGSGSLEKHAETFNFAADKISEAYHVPVLAKVNGSGTAEDIKQIREALSNY